MGLSFENPNNVNKLLDKFAVVPDPKKKQTSKDKDQDKGKKKEKNKDKK